jgi:hypothetical protein
MFIFIQILNIIIFLLLFKCIKLYQNNILWLLFFCI